MYTIIACITDRVVEVREDSVIELITHVIIAVLLAVRIPEIEEDAVTGVIIHVTIAMFPRAGSQFG